VNCLVGSHDVIGCDIESGGKQIMRDRFVIFQ
jgi:hypothetical protein